jgi:hypothetical protein
LYDIEKDDSPNNTLLTAWDLRKIINRHNGLDFETDAMIRRDIKKYILGWPAEAAEDDDFIYYMKYLGSSNGYTALALYCGHNLNIREQKIDGVIFYHIHGDDLVFAWKEGEIYELDDLYKQDLITREDLIEMAYFYNIAQEWTSGHYSH